MTIDLFHCRPLTTTLSRAACGARHDRKIGRTCTDCRVGAQHARGALPLTWEDGTVIAAAAITPATMAVLRIHLAVIAAHEPRAWTLRGKRIEGATLREHAARGGIHPQVIRSRLVRGEDPKTAVEPRLRERAKSLDLDGEVLTVRGLARKVGVNHSTVIRWMRRGLTPAAIMERCA